MRTSKKVYRCVRQTSKKYTSRPGPPYPAAECPRGCIKKGNDGRNYRVIEVEGSGTVRWAPILAKTKKQKRT